MLYKNLSDYKKTTGCLCPGAANFVLMFYKIIYPYASFLKITRLIELSYCELYAVAAAAIVFLFLFFLIT